LKKSLFAFVLCLFISHAGASESDTVQMNTEFQEASSSFRTARTMALIGYAAPIMVFVSDNEWVAMSLWMGWQSVQETGFFLMNSRLKSMRKLTIDKHGSEVESFGFSPSNSYLYGNVFKIIGISMLTYGIIQDSDKSLIPGIGILSFLVGESIHIYSWFAMTDDAQYYKTQYHSPVEKKVEELQMELGFVPFVYPSSTGLGAGLSLVAEF